jgi:DNA repair protein RadD
MSAGRSAALRILGPDGAALASGEPIELRPYQAASEAPVRELLRKHRRVLLVAPTGSGKGVQIAWFAWRSEAKGKRVIVIVHRVELIRQTLTALARFGVKAGVIAPGYVEQPEYHVQVASIATLTRPARLGRWAAWAPDLLLIDEAHHLLAVSWRRILEAMPEAWCVGYTATPVLYAGRGLGRVFGGMHIVASVRELTETGHLSPARTFAPAVLPDLRGMRTRGGDYVAEEVGAVMSSGRLIGDAIEHYRRHGNGGAMIGYATTKAHSRDLAARFCQAGLRALHVDAETPADQRAAAVAALGAGELNVLFNVRLFTEGLDLPELAGMIDLRPTLSLGLCQQMRGRALRTARGKEFAVILDHSGNTLRHGLVDEPQEWTLKDRKVGPPREAPVRRCPKCGAMLALAVWVCECGCVLREAEEPPTEVAGELVIATAESVERARLQAMSYWQQLRWAGLDYERFERLAEINRFKPGWAFYAHREAHERTIR